MLNIKGFGVCEYESLDELLFEIACCKSLLLKGWCQGTERDSCGRVCALGAVRDIMTEMLNRGLVVRLLYQVLCSRDAYFGNLGAATAVATFNDAPGRTVEEVVKLFDDAVLLVKGLVQ